MSISGIGGAPPTSIQPQRESMEGPGPDKSNDGDADDVKAAAAPGTGLLLDVTA